MQVNWTFNANQYEPNQGMSSHPPAQKIDFQITNTAIKETKDKSGGYLEVEFTSNQGVVYHRYNINNQSPKAVEIAYGQLSALCRAVNIYQIDGNNECAALRGARGKMDVGYQAGEEPGPNNPNAKGYTELKRVYDQAGNEPGKPAQPQQPQQGGNAPLQQQPGGGWGQAPTQQQQPSQQPSQGQQGGFQQQQNQPSQGQAWQPGAGGNTSAPPWGNRS